MTLVIQAIKDRQDLSMVSTKHIQKLHGGVFSDPNRNEPSAVSRKLLGFEMGMKPAGIETEPKKNAGKQCLQVTSSNVNPGLINL